MEKSRKDGKCWGCAETETGVVFEHSSEWEKKDFPLAVEQVVGYQISGMFMDEGCLMVAIRNPDANKYRLMRVYLHRTDGQTTVESMGVSETDYLGICSFFCVRPGY